MMAILALGALLVSASAYAGEFESYLECYHETGILVSGRGGSRQSKAVVVLAKVNGSFKVLVLTPKGLYSSQVMRDECRSPCSIKARLPDRKTPLYLYVESDETLRHPYVEIADGPRTPKPLDQRSRAQFQQFLDEISSAEKQGLERRKVAEYVVAYKRKFSDTYSDVVFRDDLGPATRTALDEALLDRIQMVTRFLIKDFPALREKFHSACKDVPSKAIRAAIAKMNAIELPSAGPASPSGSSESENAAHGSKQAK